jgi:tRNA nucleotidyltransferase (CCA-adding enzyme)
MILPETISTILTRLSLHGFEAYVVGGCVRDALMNLEPNDFDITTSATPSEVKTLFRDVPVIDTGIEHGTVTVLWDSCPVEVTTYRVDGEYLDRRRPAGVRFTDSIRDDLSRRDFTINAMAYSPESGIVDPFGGREDIGLKMIRCVGEPCLRFEEDALRVLRALRFASTLGFSIEPVTREALLLMRKNILDVSAERVAVEFSKMILGENIGPVMTEYSAVLSIFIPEIIPTLHFEQCNPFHSYDVYTHIVKTLINTPSTLTIRLAAFFHDIAKPQTFTLDDKGIGHFYSHQKHSAKIAEQVLDRMKFDNETKKRVKDLVFYHDISIRNDPKSIKKILNRFSESFFRELIALKRADILGQNTTMRGRLAELDARMAIFDDIIRDHACYSLKSLALNGTDLLAAGFPEGKRIGLALKDCLEQVIEEKLENEKQVLLQYAVEKYI